MPGERARAFYGNPAQRERGASHEDTGRLWKSFSHPRGYNVETDASGLLIDVIYKNTNNARDGAEDQSGHDTQ